MYVDLMVINKIPINFKTMLIHSDLCHFLFLNKCVSNAQQPSYMYVKVREDNNANFRP